ncbi:hypothetical protein DXN04_06515 [Chitinophaga silvisoli]|uniref:Uncharacterized protein n=1 Tax=Chitinophaga silvisoli TaxID=2291814 RepID=A0A3E1P4X2_9BACT|nr:hypothetical protein DXN04_06515 [Chitinophaga silvisoli]
MKPQRKLFYTFFFIILASIYSFLLPTGILFYSIWVDVININNWIKYPASFYLGHKLVRVIVTYIPYLLYQLPYQKQMAKYFIIFTCWFFAITFTWEVWSRFYRGEENEMSSIFIPILSTYLCGFMAIATNIWANAKFRLELLARS